MPAFRITGFAGIVPRRGARMLEANQAQVAVNCRLTSGYIAPLRDALFTAAPSLNGIRSIFKMRIGGTDFWLAWESDVDAVKGPIAGDDTYRTYYTGDREPRVTDLSLATSAPPFPGAFYVLGVYPPENAPGVAHGGGAGSAVSRAFLYTFVTQWGEESAPSPASAVTVGKVDGTWTISGMDTAPLNSVAITNASWAGGNATVTVSPSTFGLRVGEEIEVSGMNPPGYNTTGSVIVALTPTTVTYAVESNPGAFVAGGTLARSAPHNTTNMVKRIYWTETTASGTTFQFVKEVPVATTSTTVAGDADSGEELPSTDWPMPPTNMIGLVLHPCGSLVGISGNVICFSEPYKPYAWPDAFKITLDYDGVGLGVFGQSILAATQAQPYVIQGTDPESMIPTKVEQPWPCLSKRGIVSFGYGVMYPAPQGLVLVAIGDAQIITKDLYTQEEWTQIAPSTFAAGQYAGRYVASYTTDGISRQIVIIDKSEFASVVQANKDVSALYGDPTTGNLYVVLGGSIYQWDADPGVKLVSDWLSREFVFPDAINLGAAKVDADFGMTAEEAAAAQAAADAIEAANAALIAADLTHGSVNGFSINGLSVNGSGIESLPPTTWDSMTFQLYVDGAVKFSKTITDSKPFRLPAGYKADNAAFRVSGNITVKAITVAESMRELATA